MNYEPNLGLYDMRRDTEGLPKFLANRLNINICMKGGGGGGNTVIQGIDPEFKPQLVESLDMSNQQLKDQMSGKKEITAKMNQQQLDALKNQEDYAKAQIAGTGPYDMGESNKADLEKIYGTSQGQNSYSGTLGSARSQAAQASALSQQSTKNQRARQADIDKGISSLGKAGTAYQTGEQRQLDSTSKALDDYFARLTGAAGKQTTTTSSGGGK